MSYTKHINGDTLRLHSTDGIRKSRSVKRNKMSFKEIKEVYESKVKRKLTKKEENTLFINYVRTTLGLDSISEEV